MLKVKDLHVSVDNIEVIKGLSLSLKSGEVAAIMGPNGSGKSSLSYCLSGHSSYEVASGSVEFNGKDLLSLSPDERAIAGLFLAFQYPVEIPGVITMNFLKAALNAQRKARGQQELTTPDFIKTVKEAAKSLSIDDAMLKRGLNSGFSGGEKKRLEVLQLALFKPSLAILDETDSGLDIDALKVVAGGVNKMRSKDRSFLIITHYQRLLDYIKPDSVHLMVAGKIVAKGGADFAIELEKQGYKKYL